MKIFDNFKDFFGLGEEDQDEEEENLPITSKFKDEHAEKRSEFMKINATTYLEMKVAKPESLADAKEIADLFLNGKRVVIINLETTPPDVARRVIDFIGGVAYSKNGNINPIAESNTIFMVTPDYVDFTGDEIVSALESNGMIM